MSVGLFVHFWFVKMSLGHESRLELLSLPSCTQVMLCENIVESVLRIKLVRSNRKVSEGRDEDKI